MAWIACFSLLGRKKTLFVWLFCSFFGLPLTATIASISFGASPFHQIGWVEPYCKKAFVRFRLLKNRYSITVSTKTIDSTAVSANPTKDFGKTPRSRRHEQSIPPIMKNERPTTQRNLLKRVRYRAEHSQLHQIPNWGRATRTGFQQTILPQTRGSLHAPPQRIPPRVGRVRVQRIGKEGFANPAVPVLWCAARQQ